MSDDNQPTRIDVDAVRTRLASARGKQFWQGLEELAETAGFKEFLEREFPREAAVWSRSMDRRSFLKLLGASLALAGLAGCTNVPAQKIVPYVKAPDLSVIPGKSLYFTTAMSLSGYAVGLLMESQLGRPIKTEGNPDHPASLGATDTFAQAALLGLYDPDRSQTVLREGEIRTYNDFTQEFRAALAAARAKGGEGVRILTEAVSSPTMAAQLKSITDALPQARWHQWEPAAGYDNAYAGARLAFGRDVNTVYRFDAAQTVLALESDFLASHPDTLRYSHDFIARRKVRAGDATMNRLYAVEGSPTLTGAKADHRLRVQSGQVAAVALNIAAGLGVQVKAPALPQGVRPEWITALVRDLQAGRGSSIVIAGDGQPPLVHALAHAMNAALGNVGKTVLYTNPIVTGDADPITSLSELVQDMQAGKVSLLLVLSANPAYTAPADIPFAQACQKVGLRVHVGLYEDETAALSTWHVPEAHFLEAWSDARAFDGTVAIVQPLIEPLYPGLVSAHEVLGLFGGSPGQKSYDIVRAYWQGQHKGGDFEAWWHDALNRGVIQGSALPPITPALNAAQIAQAAGQLPDTAARGMEIVFRPDPSVYDGRFANNSWLQELPKPLTKLTWDNAVLLSPATAERLQVQAQDVVELRYGGRSVRGPVFIMPGHADESATVTLGYGRTHAGQVGTGAGFNTYLLRTAAHPWFDQGLEIVKTGESQALATTQYHWQMEGRELAKTGTLAEFRKDPNFLKNPPAQISLYPEWQYPNEAWGMAIDMTACVGCNACVLACQSENNIPVVGKEGVLRQREMHWLRIDRYYEGTNLDDPRETVFQPVPCMHCEKAPCEEVCPVGATVHSADGLNDMVYNRCVGTRYCSNNCPYKVRRFNFFSYTDNIAQEPTLKMLQNPDVTVRNRGVMEKCTYCVQRIREAQAEAAQDGRPVRDGEVMTACQAACPTNAIVFGNINDQNAEVTRWKHLPLNYALLAELNTQPRTTYLAELRNPNPEIEALVARAEPAAGAPGGLE